MYKKSIIKFCTIMITLSCATNSYADTYASIYKTATALSNGAIKQGSSVLNIGINKRARTTSLPSLIVRTVNKTVNCPNGGTLNAKGKATIDTILKTAAMNASLTLNACNAITGKSVSYLSASFTGNLLAYSASIPASKFTGKCEDGSAGTIKVSKLSVVGSYDSVTRINNATIAGSFSKICGTTTVASCNWPSPVALSDRTAVMSYCTPKQ